MREDDGSRYPRLALRRGDALIVVDTQNDFIPGGSLAVPHAEEVIPVLNWYISAFGEMHLPIFATRDWHPPNHCSFVAQGGVWPVHCVMHTPGAEFAPALQLPPEAIVISKPSAPDRETYSGFEGTQLEAHLRAAGVEQLYVGGLALDYCVLHTAKDGLRLGFDVVLLRDAVRAVNVRPDDGRRAEEELLRLGARPFQMRRELIEHTR